MAYEDLGEPRSRIEGYLDNMAGGSSELGEPRSRVEGYLQRILEAGSDSIPASSKGQPNGVASLDSSGHVPSTQLPSYVDDVIEVASESALPDPGESGKIYIALDTGKVYRWGGSAWVEVESGSETYELDADGDTITLTGSKGTSSRATIAIGSSYDATTGTVTILPIVTVLPTHESLAAYTIEELQTISEDLRAKGANSKAYATFAGFLGQKYDFGTRTGSYAGTGNDAKVIAQLVGICHDDLADGSGKAGLTFLCDRSLPYAYYMNFGDSNRGGWSSSWMRTTLNSREVWQSLPQDLRNAVKSVTKKTNNTGQTSDTTKVTDTSDKVWLPSAAEVYGPTAGTGWLESNPTILPLEGTQYAYFAEQQITFTSYSALAGRNVTNSGASIARHEGPLYSDYWWLRSPYANHDTYFVRVDSTGGPNRTVSAYGHGVCVGFCI